MPWPQTAQKARRVPVGICWRHVLHCTVVWFLFTFLNPTQSQTIEFLFPLFWYRSLSGFCRSAVYCVFWQGPAGTIRGVQMENTSSNDVKGCCRYISRATHTFKLWLNKKGFYCTIAIFLWHFDIFCNIKQGQLWMCPTLQLPNIIILPPTFLFNLSHLTSLLFNV